MTAPINPDLRTAVRDTVDDWLVPFLDHRGRLPAQIADAVLEEIAARGVDLNPHPAPSAEVAR